MKPLLSLCIILLLALPTAAQKRHRRASTKVATPASYLPEAEAAMESYDFARAAELYEKEIALLEKKKPSAQDETTIANINERMNTALDANAKLHATERILIIDSVVCPKNEALKVIRLTRESGRIDTYASTYHTTDHTGATLYENELGNKRYLAVPTNGIPTASSTATTPLHLAMADRLGDEWSAPTLLRGLNTSDITQNYPFLLSDGITLYYAAKGAESIGGYDIFVTRSDGEDGQFLSPDNIGFPYNSPANDYLLAIDEYAQLGWFVTDRRQPTGKVCVYTFVPNTTRQFYGDETGSATLRALARLTSIRDTWTQKDKVDAARKRLADLRAGRTDATPVTPDFTFIINNQRTYTHIDDFKSPVAKQKMKQWLQLNGTVQTDADMLTRLRENYIQASNEQRQQLARTINRLEATHYPQQQQLQQLAKEIRNAELSTR